MEIPKVPTIFSKFSKAVIGPGEPIVLPKNSTKPDYEAEFAFVIGTGGRHIRARGLAAARVRLHHHQRRQRARLSDGHHAMADGQDLRYLRAHGPVPGQRRRNSRSARARHQPDHQRRSAAAFQHPRADFQDPGAGGVLSSVITLEPGDVVSTGTPAGVGFARKPPRFLRPGDEVVVSVEGIGELRNPVVAEAGAGYSCRRLAVEQLLQFLVLGVPSTASWISCANVRMISSKSNSRPSVAYSSMPASSSR